MSKAVIHLSSLDVCQENIGWSQPRVYFQSQRTYGEFLLAHGESHSNFSSWRMFQSTMLIRYFVDKQYNVSVVSTWFLVNWHSCHVGSCYCGSGRICEEFINYCRIVWLFSEVQSPGLKLSSSSSVAFLRRMKNCMFSYSWKNYIISV